MKYLVVVVLDGRCEAVNAFLQKHHFDNVGATPSRMDLIALDGLVLATHGSLLILPRLVFSCSRQLLHGQDECLAVDTALLEGSWFLLSYCLLFFTATALVLWALRRLYIIPPSSLSSLTPPSLSDEDSESRPREEHVDEMRQPLLTDTSRAIP